MSYCYHKYLSALLHNPALIKPYNHQITKTPRDTIAHSAISLLKWSAHFQKQPNTSSVWNSGYDGNPYPPFHNLYACITDKEIDEFDKQEIHDHFPKEIELLKYIYANIEPDPETLNSKPRLVDLFGYVHEVETLTPVYYFNQIGSYGANIKCRNCKEVTHYKAYEKIQFRVLPTDIIKLRFQHQCQGCGNMKLAELNDHDDAIQAVCECGGQYRRDKPLICMKCI